MEHYSHRPSSFAERIKTDLLLQATALHLATAASLRDTSGGYFAGDGIDLDFNSDAYRRQSAAAVAAAAAAPFDDEPAHGPLDRRGRHQQRRTYLRLEAEAEGLPISVSPSSSSPADSSSPTTPERSRTRSPPPSLSRSNNVTRRGRAGAGTKLGLLFAMTMIAPAHSISIHGIIYQFSSPPVRVLLFFAALMVAVIAVAKFVEGVSALYDPGRVGTISVPTSVCHGQHCLLLTSSPCHRRYYSVRSCALTLSWL